MALLTNLFRRRPRPTPALSGSQASGLMDALDGDMNAVPDLGPAVHRAETATAEAGASAHESSSGGNGFGGVDFDGPERKDGPVVETRALRPPSRTSDKEELRKMVENIGSTLDRHADRSDRIVELLSDVPARMEVIPEMSRRQVHLVDAVQDHLTQIAQRDEQMQATISTLAETSLRHTEALEAIREQLATNHRGTEQLGDAVEGLEQSLVQLTKTQTLSNEVMVGIGEEAKSREVEFTRHVQNASRWMITAVICCCGAALAAVATAVLAVVT
ncbi:MAG: hypothetical protein AB8G96_03760 [Phycisphaerales bacterium]